MGSRYNNNNKKLEQEHNFGIMGNLLAWLRDYLSVREQYTVTNGVPSENTNVAHGIVQGSVLEPILFALYTSGLPKVVDTATTFLYANDTTMSCVRESVDQVTTTLNKALEKLALGPPVQAELPGTTPQNV